jgi:hypothetical protein
MPEEIQEDEIKEVTTVDEDGNIRTVYYIWHNFVASATIEFYVVHLQVTHRHEGPYSLYSQFLE